MNPPATQTDRLNTALAGRYRIEKHLGEGGMATVYLAEDLKHKRRVAIKLLKPELAAVLGAERFVQEITTTASLQHPHILPLFDSGTADSFLFYVMPFIEGETLRDKLNRETQLGVDEAVRIAREVADALDYAHRHGVIHRDIKPENILLHDGRPMVADFGIALAVSAAAGGRMTETGLSLGTPHYMSPEQATAEKEITARSDIYSIGSVLFEMLTGNPPHTGANAQQIIMKIISEPAEPVTKYRKSVPANVAAAVAKAVEKLPADRFETAGKFVEALGNPAFIAATTGVTAARGARAAGNRQLALVALAALVVGVAGTKLLWKSIPPVAAPTRLMIDFPENQAPRGPSGPGPLFSQLPDGSGLLYSGPGTTTRTQYWMRPWDRLLATRLPQSLDDGCCAVFSPGGDSLAYLTGPHTLHLVPLGGGVSTALADSGLTSVTDFGGGLDWGPDGWIYASGLSGLVRVSPRGRKIESVTTLDRTRNDLRHDWPSVLPGGRGALVTIVPRGDPGPDRLSIGLADLASGEVSVLLQGVRAVYAAGHIVFAKANGVLWAAPFDAGSLRLTGRERELADTVSLAIGVADFVVDFSIAPTGSLVYRKGIVEAFQPTWVDRAGEVRTIAPDLTDYSVTDPVISPDGKRLLLTMRGADGRESIWLKPLDGGPKVRVTFEGSFNNRPAWRPGTTYMSFGSSRDSSGGGLKLFEADAGRSATARRLAHGDLRPPGGHAWSPDGKWLVYRTDDQAAGNADIMAYRPGVDSVVRPIAATPAEELSPAVSPDNRWIAYSSNETGRREIYVRAFPDAGTTKHQISTGGGINPQWNRNGRELFYLDAASNLVSVPVSTGATFQAGTQQVLFSAARFISNAFFPQYSVAPDGQRFVMIRGENDASVHVVVVFNFVEELKRRMAAP